MRKSKDDKLEDGSDQEREFRIEIFNGSLAYRRRRCLLILFLYAFAAFMLCYAQDDATSEGIRVSRISIIELLVGKTL